MRVICTWLASKFYGSRRDSRERGKVSFLKPKSLEKMTLSRIKACALVLLLANYVFALSSSSSTFKQLRISFVTGNAMKKEEMGRILADHYVTKGPTPEKSLVQLQLLTVDLPELQEVDTLAIAKDKVILASQLSGGPCVVEDTSLKFHALGRYRAWKGWVDVLVAHTRAHRRHAWALHQMVPRKAQIQRPVQYSGGV